MLVNNLNDSCWSLLLRVNTFYIVYADSETLVANFISVFAKFADIDDFEVIQLPSAKQRLFNYSIQTVIFLMLSLNILILIDF